MVAISCRGIERSFCFSKFSEISVCVIGFDGSEVFSEVSWSEKFVADERERKRNGVVAVGFYRKL